MYHFNHELKVVAYSPEFKVGGSISLGRSITLEIWASPGPISLVIWGKGSPYRGGPHIALTLGYEHILTPHLQRHHDQWPPCRWPDEQPNSNPTRPRVQQSNPSDGSGRGRERSKVTPDVGGAVLPDTGNDHTHTAAADSEKKTIHDYSATHAHR